MKELEDCSWFPPLLRKFQTDYIGFAVTHINVYRGFIDYLISLSPQRVAMIDLCSGSGAPAIKVFSVAQCYSSLALTDKFPNRTSIAHESITYCEQSTDVTTMEFQPGKCYTMFNAFHHFSDEEKLAMINKIRNAGSSAFFVEPLEPGLFCMAKVIVAGTLGCLLLTPFIRPISFMRLFFTYVVPVNLLTITIDGIISVFKSGSSKQYRDFFARDNAVMISRINNYIFPLIVIHVHHEE